jgi:hypothetical protein
MRLRRCDNQHGEPQSPDEFSWHRGDETAHSASFFSVIPAASNVAISRKIFAEA